MSLLKDDDSNDDEIPQLPLVPISKPLSIQTARSHSSYSNSTASSTNTTTTTNATTRPNTSVIRLQFINTAHPSESTTAKRISQIRSHVAKDSHARRRQRKATKACNCSASSSSAAVAAEQTDRSEVSDSTSNSTALRPSHASRSSSSSGAGAGKEGLGSRGFRRIAPKNGGAVRKANSPGPRQLIGDAKRDGWNGSFAWNLSEDEYSVFNFYLDWVLQYGYEICFPRDQLSAVMKRMKATYVPFAIRHPALLACLFYVAYHRRSLNTDDLDEAARCSFKTERYRLACIEMMKNAIAAEEKPTYTTIALAMLLSSEAYFEGNTDASFTHAYAARTMVTTRGGLETFESSGFNGLLCFLLSTSVYSGNYWFVPGCAMAPGD